MNIEIIREKRKTLLLKIVENGKILIKAPLRLSDAKINEFIASKQKWLNSKFQKMESLDEFANSFDFDKFIYEFAKPVMETKNISLDYESLNDAKKLKAIKKQYLEMFNTLKFRAYELAEKYGFKVEQVSYMASIYKWGSFSSKGEMKLNYKLIILPHELIDYVIIHELCHSKHMNHKPQFWKEVEKFCPNYKDMRKEMKNYSFILKTDF